MKKVNGIMRLCCTMEENMESSVTAEGNVIMVHGKPHRALNRKSRCKVCHRHHYAMDVEPLDMGAILG